MRPRSSLLPLLAALLSFSVTAEAAQTAAPPVLKPTVTARYPHDRGAFTQGLQYLGGGTLLESTGQVGESGVRRVNLRTGRVLLSVPTPIATAFGEGVTQLGDVVYHITWQTGVAFALDAETLREQGRYRYAGEGWGLTHDGRSLVMSDGSATLFWRDPRTFAITKTLRVTDRGQPVRNLNELEYVQGSIYANVWLTDRIARIDPRTGRVTAWLDVGELLEEASDRAEREGRPLTFDDVPNGIAYVPERGTLLLTGKRWPLLFEVKVPGVTPVTARKP
ncbi:glutamine cyclotransferase [Deinococcus sp. RL]|uniref:glutaminyl-peptide cyclotransferase n=1 Tax=Deinococcus sp. RL TaxID=1489678 RepID=UPI0004D87C5F|nr:glutaminyl-peptide cyclotransferase [Deinococcus sp. RL]KEF33538.1 glutamine cyclotransferase [Deinococcus sp. RL]